MGTQEAINNIIRLVGGQGNINKVWHCMTRLRFDLIDDNKVDRTAIKNLPGVLGAQLQSDQFQVIIGPKVNSWYEQMLNVLGQGGLIQRRRQQRGVKAWFPSLWIPSRGCLVRLSLPLPVPG